MIHFDGSAAPGSPAPGVLEGTAFDLIGRIVALHPLLDDYLDGLLNAVLTGSMKWQWDGRPYSPQQFVESVWAGASAVFVPMHKATGRGLGVVKIYGHNPHHRFCSMGVYMDDSLPVAGAAAESIWLGASFAFRRLRARKVYGDMTGSVFEKLGSGAGDIFQVEGRLRDHYLLPDGTDDKVIISLDRVRWEELSELLPQVGHS